MQGFDSAAIDLRTRMPSLVVFALFLISFQDACCSMVNLDQA
jgi:hypothetical protein